MKRSEALAVLRVSLSENINEWIEEITENEKMESAIQTMGWFGEEIGHIMADAALAALRASADVQDYMKDQGYTKD